MTRPTRAAAHSPAPRPDAAETWPAPVARGPVRGEVRLPGSKSLTNRHLVLAALADGPCVLHGVLESRDTALMRTALTALGARFEPLSDGGLRVHPMPVGEPLAGDVAVDCGLAGTVMRFVPFVAALRPGRVRFDGDTGARLRPMAPVLDALRQLGVAVNEEGEPGRLPFTMTTRADAATVAPDGDVPEVAVDASGSSQFLSAALLAAAGMPRGLRLRHTGQTVPSPEHVAMTVGVLRALEVDVAETSPGAWTVAPGRVPAHEATVEPDLSNAGPFLAAAVSG